MAAPAAPFERVVPLVDVTELVTDFAVAAILLGGTLLK